MRTFLLAVPILLALSVAASAGPQRLDEGQLGGVAAGQGLTGSTTNSVHAVGVGLTVSGLIGAR